MHIDPDLVDTRPMRKFSPAELDFDLAETAPIHKIAILREDARAARAARDAIANCNSTAWLSAHAAAVLADALVTAEQRRLANNPKTRYGSWRTPGDIELMNLGYL